MSKRIRRLVEARRVLRHRGKAILHHAGRRNAFLWLAFMRKRRGGTRLYKFLSMGNPRDNDGWRSDVSRKLVRKMAAAVGLQIEDQLRYWGENERFGVPRYGDWITVFRKQ